MVDIQNSRSLPSPFNQRAEQRLRSQARYKVWGNTIDALRSKKKSDKVKQAEENEAYQQIIDTEESQYQEAQRRVVLDRANRILWQETDKVKHLHSGLLLSSVMKEREQQLELKKFKKAQLGEIDKTFEIIAEENRQKGLAREREEEEARLAKNHIGQKMQLEQLQLCRAKQAHERAETIAEGERMKAAAAERVKEAEKAEIERHDKMRAYNLEYLRANQESLSIRQVRADEEAKEDEKIAKFAYEKERMFALRKEHEAAKTKAKQTRFENMLQRQFNHLKNIKDSENSRIERLGEERKYVEVVYVICENEY